MRKTISVFLFLTILLSACSPAPTSGNEKCTLYYYAADEQEKLISVDSAISADTPESAVRTLFSLLTSTDEKLFTPALPSDIELLDVTISDGHCGVSLSERYNNLSADSKTAVTAALVKSLCSLSFVDSVAITCGATAQKYVDSDFITETPRTYYDTYTVNLYFADEEGSGIKADREIISLAPDTKLEHAVVSRLLRGPASDKLKSAIPAGTQLNNVYVSEGICFVDLSEEFVANAVHDELNESLAVYSVVNTVTELPMIDSVKFLINGESGYGYTYYDISKPITYAGSIFKK